MDAKFTLKFFKFRLCIKNCPNSLNRSLAGIISHVSKYNRNHPVKL